jgi:hypothetical protein
MGWPLRSYEMSPPVTAGGLYDAKWNVEHASDAKIRSKAFHTLENDRLHLESREAFSKLSFSLLKGMIETSSIVKDFDTAYINSEVKAIADIKIGKMIIELEGVL